MKASPRVTFKMSNLPRGGGRDQLGKPYQVRGKWYYPKEDKRYAKVGLASWYGDAFHGRLTANGEVYDMTHLTAAHPTMPLPSYARVTNLKTGSSVIVRVNDRGPYHEGRIIDVSQRAAEMLDYANIGTAKVKVEYVGRAPLDGNDDQYLMASYHPGNRIPDPSDGLPTGVMVAMNGPSPSLPVGAAAVPFPGQADEFRVSIRCASRSCRCKLQPLAMCRCPISGRSCRSAQGSACHRNRHSPWHRCLMRMIALQRDFRRLCRPGWRRHVARRYPSVVEAAKPPHRPIRQPNMSRRARSRMPPRRRAWRRSFPASARPKSRRSELDGKDWYSVNLYPDGHGGLDEILQAAWSHGAPDALVVRN